MNSTVAGSQEMLFGAAVTPKANDEWYTPRWIFDACGVTFDMDVCAPADPEMRTVPAREYLTAAEDGLTAEWRGYVWMNPPYSGTKPWVEKWASHANGLALAPASKSVSWLGTLLHAADATTLLTCSFHRPDGGTAYLPWLLILAGAGSDARRNVSLIAAANGHTRGAYHVRAES